MQWKEVMNNDVKEKLKAMGFDVTKAESPDVGIGDVQAILIDPLHQKLYGAVNLSRSGAAIRTLDLPGH